MEHVIRRCCLFLVGLIMPTYINGADIFKVNTQQKLVAAAFSHKDEIDPCMETEAALTVYRVVSKHTSEDLFALDYVLVYITEKNLCTDQTLVSVLGLTQLEKTEFKIATNLISANVNTTVKMQDTVTGVHLFNVELNISWSANGDPIRGVIHDKIWVGDSFFEIHATGASRPAIAAGVIFDGAMNLTPSPSYFGEFLNVRQGTLELIK